MGKCDKDTIQGVGALVGLVLLIILFIVSMVLSHTSTSKDTLGTFVIQPGEQVLKCSSKRLFIDHNSTKVKAYESFDGIPEISTSSFRDFRLTYNGSMRMSQFQMHSFFLTPGSYVRVIANLGTSTGSVMALSEINLKNYINDMPHSNIFNKYGPEIDTSFEVSKFDKYFIVVQSSFKSLSYKVNVYGTRRTYKTEDLKLSCSSKEHFENCIVNDNKTDDFCVVIDYDAPEGSEDVIVDVFKTKKRRGEDEMTHYSEGRISSSSSSVYHEISSSSSSSSGHISSSSAGRGLLSEVSDLTSLSNDDGDDSNTYVILGIVAIVAGVLVVLLGLAFGLYTYFIVMRKGRSNKYENENENGVDLTISIDSKKDPEVDTSTAYPAQSPSDIPTNIAPPVSASAPPPPPPPPSAPYPTFDDNPSYPAAPQQDQVYPSAPPPPPGSY